MKPREIERLGRPVTSPARRRPRSSGEHSRDPGVQPRGVVEAAAQRSP